MKKILFFLFLLLFFILPLILVFQYDHYSYHIWSYVSVRFGIGEIYNRENYFDRFADYFPFGSYIAIFTGKIISFFYPLSITFIPFLNFYKIFSLIVLLSFFFFLYKQKISPLKLIFLFLPFYFSIILNGQFDIIIIFLLILSITFFERKDNIFGIAILTLLFFSKPTAPFFVMLIFLHYFKNNLNLKFILKAFFIFIVLTFIIFLPFIFSGNLFKTFLNIYYNSTYMLPFSGYSFNLLSFFQNIDSDRNILHLSLKTYSLIFLSISSFIISFFCKWNIYKKISIFSLIWLNFLVGLRENHILYPLFFINLFLIYEKDLLKNLIFYLFYIIAFINIFFFVFKIFKWIHISIMSGISLTLSLIILKIILDVKEKNLTFLGNMNVFKKLFLLTIFVIFFVCYLPYGKYDKTEKNFFYEIIMSGDILEYSTDRFLDLNIKTFSLFSHHLSLRMSDSSYFKVKNLNNKYQNLSFYITLENGDSAYLFFSDQFIRLKKQEKIFVDSKIFNFKNDTFIFKVKTFNDNANLILYDTFY